MAGISKEQEKRDEQSLINFLIVFNVTSLCIFLILCVYNSI